LKASEALGLGRLITPNPQARDINTCAIGMILNVNGIPQYGDNYWLRPLNRVQEAMNLYPWLWDKVPESFPYPLTLQKCASECLQGTYYNWVITAFNTYVMDKREMTLDQLQAIIAEIEPDCGICNKFDCTCHTLDTSIDSLLQERTSHVEQALEEMEETLKEMA
jgi:hypothetical protein